MSELTPYLCVKDSRAAIEWYVAALGAEVVYEPIVMDDGRVGHCELAVDGARWMMSDEFESAGVGAPGPEPGQRRQPAPHRRRLRRRRGPGGRERRHPRPRPGGQPAGRPGRGVPRPVRPPLVPQPARWTG